MKNTRQSESGRLTMAPCTGAVLAAIAGQCVAQSPAADAGFVLEEVVVTATKRSAKLLDVPIAVSAISAEDIQARGLTQYADYLNTVPGVYFEDAGPGRSQIRIRGIVAEDVAGSATVATYFGETVTSVLSTPNLRLVDIDRVEVLRGPQGTLFGANALTGVIRIVPTAPDLQDFGVDVGTRGFTTAHSGDASYHLEGTVNVPLVQDRLALRLVAYKDEIKGYIDNVVPARDPIDYSYVADLLFEQPPGTTPEGTLVIPGNPAFTRKDINSEETQWARAALSWQPTDRLRFDLTYVTQDVTLNSEPQVEPGAGEYAQQREVDLYEEGLFDESADIGSLVIGYEWDTVSLVSATNLTKMERSRVVDESFFVEGIFGAPIPLVLHDESEGELFTQEVRLQSRGENALQWTVGAFYLDQKIDGRQFAPDYSCPTCLPTVLFGQDFAFRPAEGSNPRLLNQKQHSLFGEVSYDFTTRWTVGLGARYLEDELESMAGAIEGFIVGGFLPAEPPHGGTNSEVNPSAYVRFKAADNLTLYLQAARGFRSGQVNQFLSYTGDCAEEAAAIGLGALTDPDTLWNYELGLKSRLADGRVSVNAAVYHQEWEGVQLGTSLECGFNGTINAGDVKGEGLELEMTAQLTGAWRLNVAAAYNHNEFDSVIPSTGFEKGERVPNAPEKNVSAGVQYDFAVTEAWQGFARADYAYVGDARYKFGQGDGALIVMQDAYDTASVRLGLRRSDLAVELFGRNMTDERAVVYTQDPEIGNYQYLARPRELGIEVRYSFR
jgi:iron complex outermembrane receptor protein